MTAWSANRQAARAVVLESRTLHADDDAAFQADARLLLDMLGLVDGPNGREVLPDDTRVVRVWDGQLAAAPTNPAPGARKGPRRSTPARTAPRLQAVPDLAPAPAPPEDSPVPRSRPACGTRAGYQAHRSRKEDACGPCKAAAAAAQREYVASKKKTPTEKAPAPATPATAGTAPGPLEGPVMGERQPDAAPQVSPSRATDEGGEVGASDAPADLPAASAVVGEPEWMVDVVRNHPEPAARRAAADALVAWATWRTASDVLAAAVFGVTA